MKLAGVKRHPINRPPLRHRQRPRHGKAVRGAGHDEVSRCLRRERNRLLEKGERLLRIGLGNVDPEIEGRRVALRKIEPSTKTIVRIGIGRRLPIFQRAVVDGNLLVLHGETEAGIAQPLLPQRPVGKMKLPLELFVGGQPAFHPHPSRRRNLPGRRQRLHLVAFDIDLHRQTAIPRCGKGRLTSGKPRHAIADLEPARRPLP